MMIQDIDLLREIIECIPDDFNDLEKARFIYIKLGEIVNFNGTFNNSNFFHRILIKNRNIDISHFDNQLIMCHNWADIYVEMLCKVGIKAYKQSAYHAWVIMEIDNMHVLADATIGEYNDLTRIKYCDELINFYPVSRDRNEYGVPIRTTVEGFKDKLDKADYKINYQKTGLQTIDKLKETINSFSSLESKIDYVVHYVIKDNAGFCEQFAYFMYVLSRCLEYQERIRIHTTEMIKVNDDGIFEFMRCISLEQDDCYKYYILKGGEAYAISREQILHLVDDGYGIKNQRDILGIYYPLKFKVPKDILMRLARNNFSINSSIKNDKQKIRRGVYEL